MIFIEKKNGVYHILQDNEHNFASPYVQCVPTLLSMEFPGVEIISPVFVRYRHDDEWVQELERVGRKLCSDSSIVHYAVMNAVTAHKRFMSECNSLGHEFLKSVSKDEKIFVVLGKFYNVYDTALNLNLVEKLLDIGVTVLPFDCLPSSKDTLPWNYHDVTFSSGQDLIRAASTILSDAQYYPVMVTNFQCTPDSFMLKYLDELFSNKSYLVLEVDEHTSDVGILTRLEAFLNNLRDGAIYDFEKLSSRFLPFIAGKHHRKQERVMYVSSSYRSYRAIASALESIGEKAVMLPPHDNETLRLRRLYSSGKECNPFIMETGSAVQMTRLPNFNPDHSALCIPSSDIGCRIAFFSTALQMVLAKLGYPQVKVISPRVSMETDESLVTFGPKFVQNHPFPVSEREKTEQGYQKRTLWIRSDNYLISKAKFYDESGNFVKEFRGYELTKVGNSGKERYARVEMTNNKGVKTVIHFDLMRINEEPVDQKFFSKATMEKKR